MTHSGGRLSQPTGRACAHSCLTSVTVTGIMTLSITLDRIPGLQPPDNLPWFISSPEKLHTGSKNRAVTRKNRSDKFQNRDDYFIAQEWRFFSGKGSERNQIRVPMLGVSARWVVQLLFPLLKLLHRATKVIYETVIVPYAQHIDDSHRGPDKVSQDTEFGSCGFYFHKWKCQLLPHILCHMKLWEFLV